MSAAQDDVQTGWGPIAAVLYGIVAYLGPQIIVGLLIGIAIGVFGLSAESSWLGEDASIFAKATLVTVFSAATLTLLWLYVRTRGGLKALGIRGIPLKQYWLLLLAIGIYLIGMITALSLTKALLPGVDLEEEQITGFENAGGFVQLLLVGLALTVIVPVTEEVLFRGFLFKGLATKMSWPIAAVISSILFGLAHLQLNVGIDTFVFGMVASWLVVRTNSVVPAILLHVIKNALAFAFVFVIGT